MTVEPLALAKKRPKSLLGKLHFVSASAYSFDGFRRLLQERAFRQELLSLAVILALFLLANAPITSYFVQFILFLVLVAVESLNTAVEVLVDRISPEISHFAKHAKDLGSFAVFCLLCANGAYALLVVTSGLMASLGAAA